MKRLSMVMAVASALLAGCSSDHPTSGVIVRKDYRPPSTSVILTGGKHPVPVTIHHPAKWTIVIQLDDTTDDTGQRLIYVEEAEWNKLNVGDEWEKAYVAVGAIEKEKPQ